MSPFQKAIISPMEGAKMCVIATAQKSENWEEDLKIMKGFQLVVYQKISSVLETDVLI